MKLSISNIAWNESEDKEVYKMMNKFGFSGLEIAPTRLFENPYCKDNKEIIAEINKIENYGLSIVAMQSLHYGKSGISLFVNEEERRHLLEYTKKSILFSEKIGAKALVFGSPKLRVSSDLDNDYDIAVNFFDELGNFARKSNCCLCIEANPKEYNTNFINSTLDAYSLVKDVNNEGFRLHVDTGTMIINNEDLAIVNDAISYIKHIHISSPFLNEITSENVELYQGLSKVLRRHAYDKYVSIEMRRQDESLKKIDEALDIVSGIFGGEIE